MSCISRMFKSKSKDIFIIKGIEESKESLLRLEILTHELNEKEKLAKSHEKLFQIAMNEIDSPMWGKGLDHRFVFMNPACAEKILRTTIEDGLAMTDEDFEKDALAKVCMESDDLVISDGKTHRQIEYAKYDDGHFMFFDTTKSPWIVGGELVGTVGFGRDITKFVPDEVKEKCKKSGWVEMSVDLIYNSNDISEMILSG